MCAHRDTMEFKAMKTMLNQSKRLERGIGCMVLTAGYVMSLWLIERIIMLLLNFDLYEENMLLPEIPTDFLSLTYFHQTIDLIESKILRPLTSNLKTKPHENT